MNDTTPILECRDLSISYFTRSGEVPAVKDFNLRVRPGEAVGIVGESGCGKSTVALAIMRYLGVNGDIVGGQVLFNGDDMANLDDEALRQVRGAKISMVYQEPMASLNPSMRIGSQLAEVLIYHEKLTLSDAKARAVEMLHSVRLPDPERIMESYPHQISGGQQQRVVIAMALLSRPELLLLDEPTTALDVTVEAGIVDLIKEISAEFGTAMIYISHNLGLIMETCDRITVMYAGEAVEEGAIADVFDGMRHPYTRGLFGSIPLPGADKTQRPLVPIRGQLPLPYERPTGCNFGPRCDFFSQGVCDSDAITMRDVGDSRSHRVRCRRVDEIDWSTYRPVGVVSAMAKPGDIVLEVEGMKKVYDIVDSSLSALLHGGRVRHVAANSDIDFVAREAETVAIVGESGCGKSTFAKVLMGLEAANGGEVRVRGDDLGRTPVQERNAKTVGGLQMIFQNPFDTLNPSQTVGRQIARVIKKFGIETDAEKIRQRMFELLDLVKLPREFASRRPRQLSGGQKQRIGIARAFAGNPSLVVADEPISALDVSVQAAVADLLVDIQRTQRTTLLFISHDLSVVRYLADRVVVMYLGHIVEQGPTDQVFAPPYHPYTEALLSAVPTADTSIVKRRIVLEGEIPSALDPPSGCPFHTRCPRKIDGLCDVEMPPPRELGPDHVVRCHLETSVFDAMEPVIAAASSREASAMPMDAD